MVRKDDVLKKVKYIENKIGKLPNLVIDGRRRTVYINGIMFTFNEFMQIDINKLFVGMPQKF